MKYAVVIEKGEKGYGAYVPDLPGCIAAGNTKKEVKKLIHEAIEFHIEGLK
jgi:predicted RNase H-like HicB family nuclease